MGSGPVLVKAANWITHLDYDGESHGLATLARRAGPRPHARALRRAGLRVVRLERRPVHVRRLGRRPRAGRRRRRTPTLPAARCVPRGRCRRRLRRPPPGACVAADPRQFATPVGGWCGRRPTSSAVRPPSTSRWRASAGGATTRRSARCSPSQFLPDGTRDQWEEFNEQLRRTTSAHNAVRFLETFSRIDVTGIAPEVRCPTLILHARDDRRQPLSGARELAALIPGSRLVPLQSRNHILTSRRAGLAGVPAGDRRLPRRVRGDERSESSVHHLGAVLRDCRKFSRPERRMGRMAPRCAAPRPASSWPVSSQQRAAPRRRS